MPLGLGAANHCARAIPDQDAGLFGRLIGDRPDRRMRTVSSDRAAGRIRAREPEKTTGPARCGRMDSNRPGIWPLHLVELGQTEARPSRPAAAGQAIVSMARDLAPRRSALPAAYVLLRLRLAPFAQPSPVRRAPSILRRCRRHLRLRTAYSGATPWTLADRLELQVDDVGAAESAFTQQPAAKLP